MGTNYYIVDHARKEKFGLGRNAPANGLLIASSMDRYIEANTALLSAPPHIARKILKSIWTWCDARNWDLEIISDAGDLYDAVDEYADTGSFIYDEPEYPPDMLLMIAGLAKSWRIELCAEHIELRARIPDAHADEDSTSSVEYYAVIGDGMVEQGYYTSSNRSVQEDEGL